MLNCQYHPVCILNEGLGIASIFQLAETYNTTTGVINDLTSKYVYCVTIVVCPSWLMGHRCAVGVFSSWVSIGLSIPPHCADNTPPRRVGEYLRCHDDAPIRKASDSLLVAGKCPTQRRLLSYDHMTGTGPGPRLSHRLYICPQHQHIYRCVIYSSPLVQPKRLT